MEYCPHCMKPASGEFCENCGGSIQWTNPACQLPVGTLLRGSTGRVYQIGAAKGQGGFGITYAAMDLQNWERVAIKEYYPGSYSSRDTTNAVIPTTGQADSFQTGMKSFLEEGRMLSAVGALPSVVSVRDTFEANGTAYIVMEYVDGVPLHQVVKKGRIPWQELEPMLTPLMRDLDILHRAGIIHRDISPDNLILTPEHTLKLLDFGSARSVNTGSMTVMLKAGFSPVEQYQSKGQGPCTDVYALAATLYYCLTGVIPQVSIERLTQDDLRGPNAHGAELTAAQARALLWGMAVQPSARPQTMQQFADALLGGNEVPGTSGKNENTGITDTTRRKEPSGMEEKLRSLNLDGQKKKLAIVCGCGALALIAVVLILVLALGGGKTAGDFRYKVKSGSAWVTGYKGDSVIVYIPESLNGYTVTGIGKNAFSGCKVTSVTVPEKVNTVEKNAFRNCTKLEIIFFADSNTRVAVHADAFTGCSQLRCLVAGSGDRTVTWNGSMPNVAQCTLSAQLAGQGAVREVEVIKGIAYAITDLDRAVALQKPSGTGELPAFLDTYRVFDSKGQRASVKSGITDDQVEYELNGNEAYITGYQGSDILFVMPDEIEDCPVTVICGGALEGNQDVESVMMPLELTRIQAGAFRNCPNLRDLDVYSQVTVAKTAFENCPQLRCVVLGRGLSSAGDWALDGGVTVLNRDMDTGAGTLSYVFVMDDGTIYGVTGDDNAVLMDVPAGLTELEVPETVYGHDVTWTYAGALDNASADLSVQMAPNMGFPLELYALADWNFADIGDFSCSWIFTCDVCTQINAARTNGIQIYPDRAAVEAAVIRAEELSRSYSFTRPNGSKWSTVLDECEAEWTSATHHRDKISTATDDALTKGLSDLMDELVEDFVGTNDDGKYYTRFATALYYSSGSKTVYSASFGIIVE
ncbi:MAG: leucine-rich repeat protein [Candidatus Faecousia sp.]|nr:leucine-rich repeat protein [Candidatus Faecousia sp.]